MILYQYFIIIVIILVLINISISISISRIRSINRYSSSIRSRSCQLYNNPLNQYHDIARLGESEDYLKKLDSVLVVLSFDYLRSKLLVSDRICTLEWFNQFIEPFFNEGQGEDEMSKLISSLVTLNPEKIRVTKKSDSNPDITVDIVQVIEPRMVASILLSSRINVIDDMMSQIPLILKENAESAKYAATCLQDGENAARRNRKPVLPLSSTTETMATFASLNMLITNAALSEMRSELFALQKKQYIEYLDEFVENVAQSGTLDDLLRRGSKNVRKIGVNFRKWQEGISSGVEEEESLKSKEQDVLSDVHKPGSPRHLVERLMLQGLASSSISRDNDRKRNANKMKRKINNDEDRKEDEDEDIDVQSLAQSLIDSRANVAATFIEILNSKRERLLETNGGYSEIIETNGGYSKVHVNGVVSPALEVSTFTYNSPVLQINSTIEDNFNNITNENGTDFRVTAGKPPVLPNDMTSEVPKFGKPGWKAEDGSQTKADTSGTRQKSLISVLDPPNLRPPQPPKRNGNDIEIIEGPNDVDYLDEDFGSINDFIDLGSNTRIRIVGITEEENKKFACLEAIGGILPIGFIFRRWVDYIDAVNFLDNNMNSAKVESDTSKSPKESENTDKIDDSTQDDSDLFDDNKTPFYGGGVELM